ncbi:unnamed protein product [Blepharisma stoltei]|uniref:Uncharacterized protein n=1 Tax=Blepharisma stoltei TaxID=1481888 RepID=A0AAU9J7Y4_9CILI|nr:unnamed protein product [Blepharisma stoltei]
MRWENKFREEHQKTRGIELGTKIININEEQINFILWDTYSDERLIQITRACFRGTAAAFIIYDVTRRESFEHLDYWVYEISTYGPKDAVAVLIGNKVDIEEERKVLFEEGQKFANDHQMIYFETSAKTGLNIENLINFVSAEILTKIRNGQIDIEADSNGIKLSRLK